MFDLVLRSGTVVDGTGRAARRADVGITGGRIAALGDLDAGGAEVLDVEGLVVAPGVIDIHTHYDAQLLWDGYATPSPLHGVTTVIAGNCGFTLAPVRPGDGDYLAKMLHRVEGMPLESLVAGVGWGWQSFGDYLDQLAGNVGVNVGFLVGHTAVRRYVLGDDFEREATPAEVAEMVAVLERSLSEGGLGFSTSWAGTHNDGDGRAVPSRFASPEEVVALCEATGRWPGTTLEVAPGLSTGFTPEKVALMTEMSRVADRPLNWNLLTVTEATWASCLEKLAASEHARANGGRIVALAAPMLSTFRLNLLTGFVWDAFPGWEDLFLLPLADRKAVLADPERRRQLLEGSRHAADGIRQAAQWERLTVAQTYSAANAGLDGRTVGSVADERGIDAFDCFADIALADDLRTVFQTAPLADDEASWQLRRRAWLDDHTLMGGSDSGAHLDMLDTFGLATDVLGPTVRDRGLLTLEQAVHALTAAPAALYGLHDRGRVEVGCRADLVVFDPDRVAPGPVQMRADLPAGAARLFGGAIGVEHVLVNGVEIVRADELTGAHPGSVLRSGHDTETVTAR